MARVTKEVMAEQLAYTAELMVRLRSSYRVEQSLNGRYGCDERTARRWMQRVREMRRAEASTINVDNARDDMRDSLNAVAALALGRSQVVKNDDGSVVMTRQTKPDGTVVEQPTYKPNPDLQRALHALRELIHLDALASPTTQTIKVDADIGVMPDLKKMGPQAAKALEAFVKEISPGGKISELAGEWFKFSGESEEGR